MSLPAILLIAGVVVLFGYLVYFAVRLLRPASGQHRNGATEFWPDPVITGTTWHSAPPPDSFPPPDPYLDQFDALLLSTRATFTAIREFADAGFSIGIRS
jgi:hypothetical protein